MPSQAASPAGRSPRRDAERSREAILAAAEDLFAARGYEGASLAEIAAVVGLSRGTPSYFFGAKEQLYVEVVDRAFAARQVATAAAFAPVHAWCAGTERLPALRAALAHAAEDYLRFLTARPSFVALIMREELSGGERLRARRARSTAVSDAFTALRSQPRERGLRPFAVSDAVLLFMSLTFAPLSYRHTLMRSVGRDLTRKRGRDEQVELVVAQLMHLLTRGERSGD